ncbi:uncharacterized protein LOC129794478 [Lutzomyia longipalpis]|uniref:uncharacterized protein LOC129794478 n=1 Tax=Lutzomyia longipalpis TaxID=7200 RepID=UPI0024847276|nr:uncharacterized protein LOC129794478 [Lutzomyia longipalpis]
MDVIPLKDEWYRRIQRCYLPDEYFCGKLKPGKWLICHLSDGSEVISRAFMHPHRIFMQNLVYLDQSVMRKESSRIPDPQILDLSIVEQTEDFLDTISLEVHVSNISFPEATQKDILEEILQKFLELYTFSVGCVINLEGICALPITSVKIISTGSEGIGSVTPKTQVRVTNLIFRNALAIRKDFFPGYCEIEETLSDIVQKNKEYLSNPTQKFPPPNEILLVGSSGVGKTTLISHIARKFNCNIFPIDPIDFQGQYPGESMELLEKFSKNIREISRNQEDCLSIVSIEDIDVLCPKDSETFSASLLNFLEMLSGVRGVLVVATAKDVTNLSGNARRKGRLEVEIFLKNPSRKQRQEISQIFLQNQNIPNAMEISGWIADRTSGFVAGDLRMLIERAIDGNRENFVESLAIQLKSMRSSSIKSSNLLVDVDSVNFDDLGGIEALKRTIEVSIVSPLRDPSAFKRMGIERTKGILFYGPPGCAKTTIVRALAKRTHMPLLAVSPAQVYSPYVGDSERFLARAFHEARMCAPSILFIDELDALVGCRQRGTSDVQSRILAVLLTALDGIGRRIDGAPEGNVLAVAATNRPDVIDDALMRPGRFDKLIHVPPPDSVEARREILMKITENMPLKDVDLSVIAERTRNFSGADLKSICREAALHRLTQDLSSAFLTQDDFLEALKGTKPSLTDSQIAWYADFEAKGKI